MKLEKAVRWEPKSPTDTIHKKKTQNMHLTNNISLQLIMYAHNPVFLL